MRFVGNVQLVRGNERMVSEILALLSEEGMKTEGNPDIDVRTYPQFTVDDARALCERALTRAVSSSRRVFVVVAASLTYEAQNTMLKTLEEPPGNALFFFVVPSPATLLPTVRSRAQMLELDTTSSVGHIDAVAFLKATPEKRLDLLRPLLDKGEDDVRDISGAVAFLAMLEEMLAKAAPLSREGIDAVYRARKYIADKGSLVKTLLEQVALLVPRG